MTRKADEAGRTQLLDRIVTYALENGVASLSLRPLAKELGVTPGLLLYHFVSKEALIVEILKRAGNRQRELISTLRDRSFESPGAFCRAMWEAVAAPRDVPIFALFFEVYGMALVDRERFPDFFPGAIENWLGFISAGYMRGGMSEREARVHATFGLAAFRGFLLDLCATGDRERIDAAVYLWSERL